jgi:hypothetical protein
MVGGLIDGGAEEKGIVNAVKSAIKKSCTKPPPSKKPQRNWEEEKKGLGRRTPKPEEIRMLRIRKQGLTGVVTM